MLMRNCFEMDPIYMVKVSSDEIIKITSLKFQVAKSSLHGTNSIHKLKLRHF